MAPTQEDCWVLQLSTFISLLPRQRRKPSVVCNPNITSRVRTSYMNKINIIPISTLRIEVSNMSSLLASVLNELQCCLEILVPNAIILLRIGSKVL